MPSLLEIYTASLVGLLPKGNIPWLCQYSYMLQWPCRIKILDPIEGRFILETVMESSRYTHKYKKFEICKGKYDGYHITRRFSQPRVLYISIYEMGNLIRTEDLEMSPSDISQQWYNNIWTRYY